METVNLIQESFTINSTKEKIMKRTTGIILIILGVAMLIWTGFTYTKKEKVVDAGPIEVSANKEKSVNWPPYAGVILVIGGIILLMSGKKES
jgi:uncharacterized membrane protein HdeD (DUF308 family)